MQPDLLDNDIRFLSSAYVRYDDGFPNPEDYDHKERKRAIVVRFDRIINNEKIYAISLENLDITPSICEITPVLMKLNNISYNHIHLKSIGLPRQADGLGDSEMVISLNENGITKITWNIPSKDQDIVYLL